MNSDAAPASPPRTTVPIFLLFLALLVGSLTPIRSYDYFWHLATGRWIAEHRDLPRLDPFAVASDREHWINGEWLFQIGLYGAYRIAGHQGISILRAVFVALLFATIFRLATKRAHGSAALLLTVIAWYGADHRLTARPETAATLVVVAAIWLVVNPVNWKRVAVYLGLTILWINLHPSALLSPVLAAVGTLSSFRDRKQLLQRAVMTLGALASLVVNPYGGEGLMAPLRLMRTIGEQRFVNLEWLPSRVTDFPVLYLVIAAGVGLFLLSKARLQHLSSAALFLLLGFLAVRHVRNQGFFFAAAPLLLAPMIPGRGALRALWGAHRAPLRVRTFLAAAAGVIWAVVLLGRFPLRLGIDARLFPVQSVSRLASIGVRGNILNPDQWGGFLIWTFYPQRRVLTDGRNELYDTYLREYEQARSNNRDWRRLLEKYGVVIAVDEYRRDPIEVIDSVTGTRRKVAASLVYFPRDQWALIAYDDVAMIFVRRDAVPPALLQRFEYRSVVPDSPRFPGTRKKSESVTGRPIFPF